MAYRYSVPVNILNKELWAANKQWSYILAVTQVANTTYTKNIKYYEVQQMDRDLHWLEWLFKNHDDNGIDKGAWHTKQIVAELIEPGGWTKY